MNISSQIFSNYESNSSDYSSSYGTESAIGYFYTFSLIYIIHILLIFPINFYVIWLIVRGTGNGLLAEIFILNLSVCEILLCVHSFLQFMYWFLYDVEITIKFLDFFYGFAITGCPLFQCVICVERYLAVVHPLIFLKYKPLRYRVICSVIAWGTCLVSCTLYFINSFFWLFDAYVISNIAQCFIFLSIQLFCCLAVLRALKQSGPGERERGREEENHMKRRAFYLILITTVGMVFTYGVQTILEVVYWYTPLGVDIQQPISYACCLIAGLVQPLLFLYRVGKLNLIKCH